MLKSKQIVPILIFFISALSFSQEKTNQFDDKGERHGLWKGNYDSSKRPKYEGVFEHGKETGIFKFFDDTKAGKVIATRDFSRGNGSCYVTMFDRKNNIVSEGLLINKEYEGEWKYYHKESKVVMSSENYKKGKLNGIKKTFYDDGAITEILNYVDNKREGNYKKFGVNEKILEELNYKNDELHGDATYYDGLGNIIIQGQYKNGLKSGIWKTYEKGKVVKEETSRKYTTKNFEYTINAKGEKIPSEMKDREIKEKKVVKKENKK
jgi:antitoxin component YwqK of YwqJK toxin-antitoxin module